MRHNFLDIFFKRSTIPGNDAEELGLGVQLEAGAHGEGLAAARLTVSYANTQTLTFEKEAKRIREIERDFYLKVHLGDSNRQPQSSRENLKWYP